MINDKIETVKSDLISNAIEAKISFVVGIDHLWYAIRYIASAIVTFIAMLIFILALLESFARYILFQLAKFLQEF